MPCRVKWTNNEYSWTVNRPAIEAQNHELEAVNPHTRGDQDTRTPEELLNLSQSKGREVATALAALLVSLRRF
jgi:hypothetical protein